MMQTGEALWTIEVSQKGNVICTANNMSGNRDGGAYVYNALDAILFGVPSTGFYIGADSGSLTVYFTEVRGITSVVEPEPEPEPEEPEVELIGEKIAESATLVGQLKVGDQHGTATTEIAAPAGFGNVYKYVEVREAFHGANYSDLCLTDYSVVTFAVKATKMRMNSDWDESNEWLVFTMTQTSEAFWTIVVTKKGEVIHTATEVNGTRDDGNYAYNTLASILYGKSDYIAWNVDGTVTMYVTELRGISTVEEEPEVELVGDEITECAVMLGTMDTGSKPMQKTTEIAAPEGFGSVYKYEDQGEAFHGGNYSNVCLTEYSVVTFAVKSAKMKLYGDWNESNDWLVFTMTQTSEAVWTITITQNGAVIRTDTGVSGARDGGAYTYNALDAILYGGVAEYNAWNVDGTVKMYITELRDISNVEQPEVELVGTIVDDCAYLADEANFNATTEIANADGFEKLYKHVSAGDSIHGMLFSGTNLDNYKMVTFAVKTANFNMNSEGANESNEWLIFTLTQVSPDTWDLVVTCDGAKVFEKSGLNGAYNSEANPAYSDNALDAILYGNPRGFSPTRVNAELVVYVTELRGILAE
jgi:hypothetical protein